MNAHLLAPAAAGFAPPPAFPLLFTDAARAAAEVSCLLPSLPWLASAPRGDGHAVLVLPGFFAGDGYTAPLRNYLRMQGFAAHGWGHGPNWGRWDALDAIVIPAIERLFDESGRKVSLVGASMGGLYARAAAHVIPDKVRCVVTFGSAATEPHRANYVWPLFQAATAQSPDTMTVPPPPLLPSTSVYSHADGLSDWRPCLQPKTAITENVAVASSHLGMVCHPGNLYLVADRLAQAEGEWRPFEPPAWGRLLYRTED
jgi:pimeloyl-ACP methyl ester carboxylesterase